MIGANSSNPMQFSNICRFFEQWCHFLCCHTNQASTFDLICNDDAGGPAGNVRFGFNNVAYKMHVFWFIFQLNRFKLSPGIRNSLTVFWKKISSLHLCHSCNNKGRTWKKEGAPQARDPQSRLSALEQIELARSNILCGNVTTSWKIKSALRCTINTFLQQQNSSNMSHEPGQRTSMLVQLFCADAVTATTKLHWKHGMQVWKPLPCCVPMFFSHVNVLAWKLGLLIIIIL